MRVDVSFSLESKACAYERKDACELDNMHSPCPPLRCRGEQYDAVVVLCLSTRLMPGRRSAFGATFRLWSGVTSMRNGKEGNLQSRHYASDPRSCSLCAL